MELRHGKAFEKNYDSFRQAGIHKDNERVFSQRMEDLQSRTPEMIRDVFRFLGEEIEDANFNPSRRGADSIGTRHGQKNSTTKMFADKENWSCFSPNDLHFVGQLKGPRDFYEIPEFPFKANSYPFFCAGNWVLWATTEPEPSVLTGFSKSLSCLFPRLTKHDLA